ncbi:MAG: hypothetical protein AAB327_01370 [Actinomycetota bacterium]
MAVPAVNISPIVELEAGSSVVEVDGQSVESEQVQDGNAVTVIGGDVVARVSGTQTDRPDSEKPALVLTAGNSAQLSLQGLAPDSEVQVIIFSEPRHLGVIKVDSLGGFFASVKIPSDLEPGSHTLVISGLDKNGSPMELKFGLVVHSDRAIHLPLWMWPTVTLLMLASLSSATWIRKVNREKSEFWITRMRGGTS